MTKEEIEMYYDLLSFKYEAAIGALYARDLVDDEWIKQSRKRFFDKLEQERELHYRRISDYEASIRLFFSMMDEKPGEYVSLTDIARKYSQDPSGYTIQSWMRSKNTIAYLRIWELINNYYFDDEACAALIEGSKNASFNLTPSKWISSTNARGIRVKRGKGGGVEAHEDIAMDFRLWIDPNFRHHLIWYVREHRCEVYAMIEEKDYMALGNKIICVQCGNHFCLENADGKLIFQCMGSYECSNASCNAPLISWDDLADAVNSVSTIVDLYLDFLWEAIDHVEIDGYSIVVTMDEIIGERKSQFLRLQDYWLAHHSLRDDAKARELLYSIHAPLVKKKLHHLGYTSSLKYRDLEDLEQAIWLRTFRLLSSYNGQYRFWTWMRLLIRTEFHRSYVRKKKEITSDDAVRIQHETRVVYGKSNIDCWVDNEHVNELLSVLSDRERYVVIEYLFKGRQQKELAFEMHVCRQKVSEVYHRALRKMRIYELSNGSQTDYIG